MSNQASNPWIFGAKSERHRGVEILSDGELLTVAEAIKQGGLDWMVELRDPVSDDDDQVDSNGWKMVVKTEDVTVDGVTSKAHLNLGMVKGRYTLLQNRAAFNFFDNATMSGAAVIKAVGHLDHGRVVWAVAERPNSMELIPGDVIHQNLVLVTAHDGSHAVKVMFTPYRSSTGTMLGVKSQRRMKTEVRVRHTKSIDVRMATLHNVLSAETGYFDRWRTALVGEEGEGGFKRRLVTMGEINSVVNSLFPAQKKINEDGKNYEKVSGKATVARNLILERIDEQREASRLAYTDADQEAPNGPTALDVFLGIGEYVAKDRKAKNEGNSWVTSTFGTGATMRQRSFDLITGLGKFDK
jgi:phage/plasmid-like protein (TIGR03299 family)